MQEPVQNVVIVGGGTAGWMTAAYLAKFFSHKRINLTLIGSSEIGSVGVGEATIPTIREFCHSLGLQDSDVIKATKATYKLGIEFRDWHTKGSSFFHPFANYGQSVKGVNFHHYWNKMRLSGYQSKLDEFSLGAMLARHNKFNFPSSNPPSSMSVFDWALHFDAGLFAKMLQEYAVKKGVKNIDDKITQVNLRKADGFIESLNLEKNNAVAGNFFIDCSGFKGLLIEDALKTGYEDWSKWLFCDKAMAIQSESNQPPLPYTVSTAESAGWRWNIPLQNRNGNGHVYSSQYMNDDEAASILLKGLNGTPTSEPKTFNFIPGRRKQAWNKNCVAVGLSSGFLEPLESTSIALIELAIQKIRLFFPDKSFNKSIINEFNTRTQMEYERVRDFIIFHYKANKKDDSEFWRSCRAMEIPDELSHKIELFKARGYLLKYPYEIFQMPSWLAVYTGNDYLPESYNSMADAFNENQLTSAFDEMRKSVLASVRDSPDYINFLEQKLR